MPTSPDLTPYNPLPFYDLLPQDLVARALTAVQTYLPEYAPVEGDIDLELLGAIATLIAEDTYAINRLPDGLFYALSNIEGVPRLEGGPATVTLQLTITPDPNGVDIPDGFQAALDLGNGDTIVFATTDPVVSAPNATTVQAGATATTDGTAGNSIPTDTTLIPLTALGAVTAVTTTTTSSGGTDPEDDQAFLARYTTRRQRATQALAAVAHFGWYAAEAGAELGVYRARPVDQWDGTSSTPGQDVGHITVAVRGPAGAQVPTDAKNQLANDMDTRAYGGLMVHVVDATITTVNVNVTVVPQPGYTQTDVTANIGAALGAYLNPDRWLWGGTVYRNELISVIDQAAGVDRVASITTPATDMALSGPAPLVQVGTVTVSYT